MSPRGHFDIREACPDQLDSLGYPTSKPFPYKFSREFGRFTSEYGGTVQGELGRPRWRHLHWNTAEMYTLGILYTLLRMVSDEQETYFEGTVAEFIEKSELGCSERTFRKHLACLLEMGLVIKTHVRQGVRYQVDLLALCR